MNLKNNADFINLSKEQREEVLEKINIDYKIKTFCKENSIQNVDLIEHILNKRLVAKGAVNKEYDMLEDMKHMDDISFDIVKEIIDKYKLDALGISNVLLYAIMRMLDIEKELSESILNSSIPNKLYESLEKIGVSHKIADSVIDFMKDKMSQKATQNDSHNARFDSEKGISEEEFNKLSFDEKLNYLFKKHK